MSNGNFFWVLQQARHAGVISDFLLKNADSEDSIFVGDNKLVADLGDNLHRVM